MTTRTSIHCAHHAFVRAEGDSGSCWVRHRSAAFVGVGGFIAVREVTAVALPVGTRANVHAWSISTALDRLGGGGRRDGDDSESVDDGEEDADLHDDWRCCVYSRGVSNLVLFEFC
jgi:hypothetical protein